jgi:hypothetical protein
MRGWARANEVQAGIDGDWGRGGMHGLGIRMGTRTRMRTRMKWKREGLYHMMCMRTGITAFGRIRMAWRTGTREREKERTRASACRDTTYAAPVRLVYYIATKEQQFTRLRTTTTTHPISTSTSTTTPRMLQKNRAISYHQQHVKGRGGTRCTETGIQLYCFSTTMDTTPCSHHSGSHSRRARQASTTPYLHPDRPCRD